MASKHKRQEAPRGGPAKAPPVDLDDPVEVASVDSFPASDPPGWITERPRKVRPQTKPRQAPKRAEKQTARPRSAKH